MYNNQISLIGSNLTLTEDSIEDYADILKNKDKYIKSLNNYINSIGDNFIQRLVKYAYEIVGIENFCSGIGGLEMHHTEIGGLLRHTVGVVKTAISICSNYKELPINKDIIIAGCLLHDIGKVNEYNISGYVTSYNNENLHSHLIDGCSLLGQAYNKIHNKIQDSITQSNKEAYKLITHIIASHHRLKDWGTLEEPNILEAEIVCTADYIDSHIDLYTKTLITMGNGEYNKRYSIYKPNINTTELMI